MCPEEMNIGDEDKFEPEKRDGDIISYHSANMSSDWQFGVDNLANSSMGLILTGNPMAVCRGGQLGPSSCSSVSMVDSFCPTIWDQPTKAQHFGFVNINTQDNASTSNAMGIRKPCLGPFRTGVERTFDTVWTSPNSMLKGGMFMPSFSGGLSPSLSQFPADSNFIERAARFSCFNGRNFGDMTNLLSFNDSVSLYSRGVADVQGPQEVFMGNGSKSLSGRLSGKNEVNTAEASEDCSLSAGHGVTKETPLKNENLMRSCDEAKRGRSMSGNDSDEAEFRSGGGEQEPSKLEGPGGEPMTRGLGSKKRKRSGQDIELDQGKGAPRPPNEAAKDNTETQQKGDDPASATNKPGGKHSKQGSQASDSPKEEYIHVRARRGQATNSHSLAERVRREKISERMKFLQDLVPGCSKVTGKAVMLDEIINYVQSLQRQVEFLSMKLATVIPRLDFNIDGLLAKDILQAQAAPLSALGFPPDMSMPFPTLHPSHPVSIQTGLSGVPSSSNGLHGTFDPQLTAMIGGYKEPHPQVPNSWEDELHNVVQMGFCSSAPAPASVISQDLSDSLPPGHMKVEL